LPRKTGSRSFFWRNRKKRGLLIPGTREKRKRKKQGRGPLSKPFQPGRMSRFPAKARNLLNPPGFSGKLPALRKRSPGFLNDEAGMSEKVHIRYAWSCPRKLGIHDHRKRLDSPFEGNEYEKADLFGKATLAFS
jgi:hypothetical protein